MHGQQNIKKKVFTSIVPPLTIFGRHTRGEKIFQNDIYIYSGMKSVKIASKE